MKSCLLAGLIITDLAAYGNIRIAEISLAPGRNDTPAMVELENTGPEAMTLDGFRLVDGAGHTLAIPPGTVLKPGQLLVAVAGDPPPGHDDAAFWVAAPESRGAFAEELLEECSLYRGPENTPDNLVEYVQWGHESYLEDYPVSDGKRLALSKGIWKPEYLIETVAPEPVAGRSLGRLPEGQKLEDVSRQRTLDASRTWFLYRASEVSFGRANTLPPPVNTFPELNYFGMIRSSDQVECRWTPIRHPDGWFRFQLSRDPDFSRLILDRKYEVSTFRSSELSPGHYFWRVREETPDHIGEWSPVSPFVILFKNRVGDENTEKTIRSRTKPPDTMPGR